MNFMQHHPVAQDFHHGKPGLPCSHVRPGSALVAVFWIIAVLSLAVFAAVRLVYHDADVASSKIHGFEAWQAAERGIAVAVNRIFPTMHVSNPRQPGLTLTCF